MAKQTKSNVKVITSGRVPTTAELPLGYVGFGVVGGTAKIFFNSDNTVREFSRANLTTVDLGSTGTTSNVFYYLLNEIPLPAESGEVRVRVYFTNPANGSVTLIFPTTMGHFSAIKELTIANGEAVEVSVMKVVTRYFWLVSEKMTE